MATAVVIPLRSFAFGKERLTSAFNETERAAFVAGMARAVVAAAGERTVAIVSSAPDVLAWARDLDLVCIDDPGDLDRAARAGVEWARNNGFTRVVIAHGDLPLVSNFDAVDLAGDVVAVVPDQRNDGTPVISLPSSIDFAFAYGPGSAARHIDAARRTGCEVRVVRDPALAFDVDTPADLSDLTAGQ
jgi:2-phospho-L-lactate guanylyltransferase